MVKKMDDKLDLNAHKVFDLLLEEIYGNVSTVYHRCNTLSKLESIIQKTYRNSSHIHVSSYNSAIYTTYDMKSQKNEIGNRNDMKATYGDFIIKFGVKGLHNFIFMDYEQYKKIDPRSTKEDYAERQVERLLPKIDTEVKKELIQHINHNNHVSVGNILEQYKLIGRVKGIEYVGNHDGDCLLVFDYTSLVPISYTEDEGKTWKKIYEKKYINNFKNNDNNDENVSILYNKNGWELVSAKNTTAVRKLINRYWPESVNKIVNSFNRLNINSIRSIYLVQQKKGKSYFIYLGENLKSGRDSKEEISEPEFLTGVKIYTTDSKGDKIQENINNFLKIVPDEVLKLIKMDDTGNNLYSLKKAPKRANKLPGFTNKKTTTIPEIKDAKKIELNNKEFGISDEITDDWGSIIRADANHGNIDWEVINKGAVESEYRDGAKEQEFLETGKYPKEKAKSLNKKAYTSYYYFKKIPHIYLKATRLKDYFSQVATSNYYEKYANGKLISDSEYKYIFSLLNKAAVADNKKALDKNYERMENKKKEANSLREKTQKKQTEFREIFNKKLATLGYNGEVFFSAKKGGTFPNVYIIEDKEGNQIQFYHSDDSVKYHIAKQQFVPPKETLEKIQNIIKEMNRKVVTLFADEIQSNRQNNLNKYNMFEERNFFNY